MSEEEYDELEQRLDALAVRLERIADALGDLGPPPPGKTTPRLRVVDDDRENTTERRRKAA
jgi:hypothetical protein